MIQILIMIILFPVNGNLELFNYNLRYEASCFINGINIPPLIKLYKRIVDPNLDGVDDFDMFNKIIINYHICKLMMYFFLCDDTAVLNSVIVLYI